MLTCLRHLLTAICVSQLIASATYASQDILINFHARIQLDAHNFIYPNEENSNLPTSLSELRRARVENIGVFYNTFKYKISAELTDEVKLEDAYISLQGDALRIQMGQFYYPFGNETQGSSKYSEFMEKSSITSLVSYGRDRGISIQTYHSRYLFLQAGVVRGAGANTVDNNDDVDKVIRFGLDSNPRGKSNNRYLFGFSGAAGRQKASAGDSIKIKTESHSELTLFKATFAENTEYLRSRFGVESTVLNGAFMFKPEFFYVHYGFDQPVHILGFYMIGSYFLTGEQRSLNNGLLTRQQIFSPISHGGWGAWEVALRYSAYTVDPDFYRNDTLYLGWKALSRDKYPQKAYAVSLGLNWYPQGLFRLMINEVLTFTQHASNNQYDLRENALMFRMQAEY